MEQISQHLSFLPEGAVGPVLALLVIVIGYFIAKIAQMLVSGAINRTGIGRKAKSTGGNIGKSLSKAVFWVIWLIFILMGLSQFPVMAEQLGFLNGMMENIFNYLPQLVVGAAVFAIGVMLANVVKNALTSALEVAQVDTLASRFGVVESDGTTPTASISNSLGGLAKAIVIIMFAIVAIGIWDIPGFSDEVSEMLGTVLDYIPSIIGAAAILGVSVFIGRFVSNLVRSTLPALGVDNSIKTVASLDDGEGPNFVPSNIIATISFVGIVLMGLTAAMKTLGIPELTEVFNTLLEVGGRVVLGAIIIGAGLFIANFVSRLVTQTSGELAGKIVKYTTIAIVTFMGLETMQLGEEIVQIAFENSVKAAAVAAGLGGAIAFGMGGREWASKKLNEWWPAKATKTTKTATTTRKK